MQGELSCSLHMHWLHVPCSVVEAVECSKVVEELRRWIVLNIMVIIEPDRSYAVRRGMLLPNCALWYL